MPFELLIGAAVGAGLASPGFRKVVRKGVVYTLAGALMAYDKVSGVAADIKNSVKKEAAEASTKTAAEGCTANGDHTQAAKPAASVEPAVTV